MKVPKYYTHKLAIAELIDGAPVDFGPGDLEGLARLGAIPCA